MAILAASLFATQIGTARPSATRSKTIAAVWLLGIPWALSIPFARGACDSALSNRPALFEATVELSAEGKWQSEVTVPAAMEIVVIAREEGVDATLEASTSAQRIIRAATPIARAGTVHARLTADRAAALSLALLGKSASGSRGRVAIRVLSLGSPGQNDACVDIQRQLSAADAAYAAGQAVTKAQMPDGGVKVDARKSYRTAADGYLAVARKLDSLKQSLPLAQALHAAAAVLYDDLFDWEAARSWAETAADRYASADEPYGRARAQAIGAAALMEIALTLPASHAPGGVTMAGSLAQARRTLGSLAAFHATRHERLDQALAQNNIGLAYYYEGRNNEAIGAYRRALALFEQSGQDLWRKIALQNIALADYEIGRVTDAIAQYERVLQLISAGDDPALVAATLDNSARANWVGGNIDVALSEFSRALQIEHSMQNAREQARTLHSIGAVYESIGEYDLALDFDRQALALLTVQLDARGRTASLRSTANLLRALGHPGDALAMHDEALSLATTPITRAQIQLQRVRDLVALGRPAEAREQVASVLNDSAHNSAYIRAQARLERAKIDLAKDAAALPPAPPTARATALALHRTKPEADLRAAIAVFRSSDAPVDEFTAWMSLAGSQFQRGAETEALRSVDEALSLAEEVRLQSANPELRASLLRPLRPAFDLKIAILAHRYFDQTPAGRDTRSGDASREGIALRALATSESARSRVLRDFQRYNVNSAGVSPKLLEQRQAIYRELAERHFQLESRRDRVAESDARIVAIRSDIATLRAQLDSTEAQVNAAAAKQTAAHPELSLEKLQAIPQDTAIVEYWLGNEQALAWVLTREHLKMVDLGPAREIVKAARAFHSSLRGFGVVPITARLSDSEKLSSLVIQPVIDLIGTTRAVVTAPDDALHYVPFAALRAHGSFLVEQHDLATAPSIRMLLEADRGDHANPQPSAGMLLLADPVYGRDDARFQGQLNAMTRSQTGDEAVARPPSRDTRDADSGTPLPRLAGTAREAALIASLLPPGQVDRLEGFAASKERFLQSHPERYRYIHIASHATMNAEVPELSALLLSSYTAEGRPVDGKVLGADIMTLQLNADLVVLSACDTALGKNVAGEGLMGLRYVALARGAHSVVSSLWEVPDMAAANLMDGFYRSLMRSKVPIDVALSQAMRGMITGGQSDPALWAAFTATVADVPAHR